MPRFRKPCNDVKHARPNESAYNFNYLLVSIPSFKGWPNNASNNKVSPPFNTQYPPQVLEYRVVSDMAL